MSYMIKVQKAIDFIEENLDRDIVLKDIAEQAGFSMFYFDRVFKAMLGESVAEYLRKRRLTNAAQRLLSTDQRILDIALEYQFSSQESFTRSFKRMFGLTPGEYRKHQVPLFIEKPPVTEQMLYRLNNGLNMEPKIIEKEGFTVVGIKHLWSAQGINDVAGWLSAFMARAGEIKGRVGSAILGLGGYISNEEFTVESKIPYIACAPVNSLQEIPQGMVPKTVPPAKYAVFTHAGTVSSILETCCYVLGTWLPKSGYELAEQDNFEYYSSRFLGPDNYNSEIDIYYPIL